MKSPLDQLSEAEKETLVHLYDSLDYKALSKLVENMKTQLAQQHVGELDIGQIRYLTGGIGSLNNLLLILRENFKELNKES